jgi:soluble lytic murein transglycosylase-like protein
LLFKSPRRWVVGLSLLLTLQISPLFAQSPSDSETTDSRLVEAVVLNYDKNPEFVQNIVTTASKYEYADFPKREDIMAIIAVESRFEPKSQHKGSVGLMQVNRSANKRLIEGNLFDTEENIRVGVLILRTYYLALGNARAAVLAYNSGIGGYLKGAKNQSYYKKYLKNRRMVEDAEQ